MLYSNSDLTIDSGRGRAVVQKPKLSALSGCVRAYRVRACESLNTCAHVGYAWSCLGAARRALY